MKQRLRIALLVAAFSSCAVVYGLYSWMRDVEARSTTAPGVTCYTGQFPSLIPVQ